jgi:hypothetical protein
MRAVACDAPLQLAEKCRGQIRASRNGAIEDCGSQLVAEIVEEEQALCLADGKSIRACPAVHQCCDLGIARAESWHEEICLGRAKVL